MTIYKELFEIHLISSFPQHFYTTKELLIQKCPKDVMGNFDMIMAQNKSPQTVFLYIQNASMNSIINSKGKIKKREHEKRGRDTSSSSPRYWVFLDSKESDW